MTELLNWVSHEFLKQNFIKLSKITFIIIMTNISVQIFTGTIKRIFTRDKLVPKYLGLLTDIIKYLLWIISVIIILSIMGFEEIVITLGGSLALLGILFAQTFSSFLRDFIAGIFLILDEDFKIGIYIKTGKIEGRVENLSIRKTKIRDTHGYLHIIPNRKVDLEYIIMD